MIENKNIIDQHLYFAKFVTKEVREQQVIKKDSSTFAEYSAFVDMLIEMGEADCIPALETFIFSINPSYVSNAVKNATGYLMFVEYGNVNIDKEASNDRSEMLLAISIAHEVATSNSDMIEEVVISQKCFDILKSIMDKMYQDFDNPDSCQENELLIYPAEMYPIVPSEFFGRGGWTALFKTGAVLK